MSAVATAWAWQVIAAGLVPTATARVVLLKLADRADDHGKCWPGHERTAADCDISLRGSRDAHAALEKARILLVERRQDTAGRDLPNVYRLPIFGTAGEGANFALPPANPAPGGEQNAPESNKTNLTKDSSSTTTTTAGAAASPAIRTTIAAGKRRRVRPSGIVTWTDDDGLEAERIEREHSEGEIGAAIMALAGAGKQPVPGLIAGEIERQRRTRQADEQAASRHAAAEAAAVPVLDPEALENVKKLLPAGCRSRLDKYPTA